MLDQVCMPYWVELLYGISCIAFGFIVAGLLMSEMPDKGKVDN